MLRIVPDNTARVQIVMSAQPLKESEPDPSREDDTQQGSDGGGGGGYDGPMHRRLFRLEEFAIEARQRFDQVDARLVRVGTRLDRVESRLARAETLLEFTATRVDVESSASSSIKWMIGVLVALSMAAITIVTFVLNYASPPRQDARAAPAQPIVVYPPLAPAPGAASGQPLDNGSGR